MIKRLFPILFWLPNYQKKFLAGDITAGLTVGIMLIPQSMAYAMIAGLPPVYGLYAALMPQLVYALMGTSPQLNVGPVAMDSLLVAAGLSALSLSGVDEYIAMALALALFVGGIQLLLGVLKMGFLVHFLSKPVISGFTSAAALIIGST
jgi:SulP family sulfate permease